MVIGAIAFFWPFIEEWLTRRWPISDKMPVIAGVLAFLGFLILTVWEAFAA
jgi:hypothetical protein